MDFEFKSFVLFTSVFSSYDIHLDCYIILFSQSLDAFITRLSASFYNTSHASFILIIIYLSICFSFSFNSISHLFNSVALWSRDSLIPLISLTISSCFSFFSINSDSFTKLTKACSSPICLVHKLRAPNHIFSSSTMDIFQANSSSSIGNNSFFVLLKMCLNSF